MVGTQQSSKAGKREGRGSRAVSAFNSVAGRSPSLQWGGRKGTSEQRYEGGREPAHRSLEVSVPEEGTAKGKALG